MMHRFLSLLHEIPEFVYVIFIVLCTLLWAILSLVLSNKKVWAYINRSVVAVTVAAVVFVTLITRDYQYTQQVELTPFAIFEQARIYPDVYNQMILNVVLFLPLGLSLPFVFLNKIKHPVLVTIAFAFRLSVTVEVLQYILKCGYSELDDVMLNTIGAACGASAYLMARFADKKWQKRKNQGWITD